jgi:hypothetical protein
MEGDVFEIEDSPEKSRKNEVRSINAMIKKKYSFVE